jgi:hypothetical protein
MGLNFSVQKLKRYTFLGAHKISADLIQIGGETLRSEFRKFIHSVWNKEELLEQWKESIIVPIYKKSNKTDCSNYRGISLLSTSYKILPNILLSRLTAYVDNVIWGH